VGKAAAKALVAQGWRVIGIGRDPARSAAAEAEIRATALGVPFEMLRADLSLMRDAASVALQIAARTDRIDALLNNAGGVNNRFIVTSEGIEATLAGNHLGHFVLTHRLMPLLQATARQMARGAVRVVNVSSTGHDRSPGLDWNDLPRPKNFSSGGAYTNAKLANILFTRALAQRLAPDGIVAHAMHPGVVDSNFVAHAEPAMQQYMATLKNVSVSPDEAADTLVWLATADEPGHTSGDYYYQRKTIPTSVPAQDTTAAERLWIESEALVDRILA
jgi:NAD(P)-dependent dehydrogenase (short-subunit alcohol dehydrogenase family)